MTQAMKPLQIALPYGGRDFLFEIHHRQFVLGAAGPVEYYWMDSRQLRQRRGGPNFRPCVDLWWHVAQLQQTPDEVIDNEVNLVLAECYPWVNTARAVQNIYIDAHVHPNADRDLVIVGKKTNNRKKYIEQAYSLPDDEVQRLRHLAGRQDSELVREELEGLFLGEMPPREEMPAYQEAAQAWLGNGIVALRTKGCDGLRNYACDEIQSWITKFRKRGNVDRVRQFLNLFCYECKTAFYRCYASAWMGLLWWLKENRNLGTLDERFMLHWHNQNQPQVNSNGEHVRDAFCGQVLALHPLSAVIMNSPQHLHAIALWIAHPNYDAFQKDQAVHCCREYWEGFVAAILIAAHEYDHAHRQGEMARGQATYTKSDMTHVETSKPEAADFSIGLFLEDYAVERQIACPHCGSALRFASCMPPPTPDDAAIVTFRCGDCQETHELSLLAADLLSGHDS